MTKLFSTEAKWLCFVLFVFQMSFAQTCNVVTNSTFTGNSTGWTVGGTGVGWYYEPTWAPNEIYIEKDGATNQSLRQPLTGLINNSLTLSFKIKGQNANRLSTCPTTATLVIRLGGVTYMTINNVAGSATTPNTQITTANITTSNGATYTQSGFPLTVGGATSAITITQGTITLTIPWVPATATAADLEFLATTSNTASGSCTAWGGDDWFLDDIMLYTSNPVAYNMTGSSVCSGTTTTVGLSNSQLGVNYQLYRNGSTAVGSPVAGTGSAISFGSQSVTGVYTAVATAGTSTCTTPMNNSVSINPNPTLTTAAQPAAQPAVCSGSAGTINLTGLLPSTTSTINYTINGVAQTAITGVVSDASGAGSFTTPVLTVANNGQTLRITSITNTSATPNCSTSFATDVILAVRSTPTLTGASQSVTACAGSGATINLTGLLPSVTSTISYSINGVAQSAVTGVVSNASGVASFTTVALTTANNGQNLQITGVTTTSTSPNCTTSFTQNVTLSVIASPTITTAAATGVVTAICQSASAQTTNMTYTATTLSPTSYSIDWATLTDQSSTAFTFAAGGGTVTGIIVPAGTPSGTYTGTMTVTSASGCTGTKAITLTINPVLTASVSISNSPAGTVCAGTNVTFTATPTNPGTAPVYQWKLNGVNVGTNSTTYSNSTLLLNNDVVTCEMTSNASPCLTGSPATSNAITVASAGPTTTGVTICTGGSGSLSSSTTCANGSNQTSGPNNARSGANNTGVGTIAWTNPGNITTVGTPYATRSINNNNTAITNYLIGSDYDFSGIPTNAIIGGITVTINRRTSGSGSVTDSAIRIVKGGSIGSTNRSTGAVWNTSGFTTVTYGGTSDLWGTTWSVSDIQNSNFGVALSALISTNNNRTLSVDYMQITVTYTVPGSIDWYTASSGGTLLGSGASFNPVGVAGSGLANTNTVGTTTFYAECSSNPGCRTPVTFVINATPTIAAISSPSALCPGGSLNPAAPTVTANGSTVTATGWQLETTVGGGAYANLTVPYTVAFADSGKRIRYYATSGCGTTNSNAVVITVNPTPSAPTVGTITHLTCAINTGSVVLQGLPSGNWTINQAGDATASYNNTVPNTTSTTISGLAVGNYTFSVTDANGCPSAVSNVSILDNYNTWNGSSWSRGVPPNASMNATIASVTPSSPFTVDLVACALTINSGVVATVPSGVTLTITNEVTVNGSLTFENNASLVQINNLNNNSGSITYKRSSQAMKRYDFTYWSSPVENQTLSNLSPNTRW
ncbi:beta strand repeat-containing protein, partial [Flavobacterium cheongpyeongense]